MLLFEIWILHLINILLFVVAALNGMEEWLVGS